MISNCKYQHNSKLHHFILFLFSVLVIVCNATEVNWTPNEDAENAPLPLSMKQRQQLVQLQQAIQSSPDPNGTLQEVAQANNMSPQDLVNMIEKNARDLAQDPSLMEPKTIPKELFKAMKKLGALIRTRAEKNPKAFAIASTSMIVCLYASIEIPRTGLVMSKRNGLFSRGPTTMFVPTNPYLQRLVDNSRHLERKKPSIKTQKMKWDDLFPGEDGVIVHKLKGRKQELIQAVSAQVSIEAKDLLRQFNMIPHDGSDDNDDDDNSEDKDEKGEKEKGQQQEENKELVKEVVDLLFDSCATVFDEKKFSEFVEPSENTMKFMSSSTSRQKHAVIAQRNLGNWRRYGIMTFRIAQQQESNIESTVTYSTLKGLSHFDGQVHFSLEKHRSKIVIRVHVIVPKRGRKLRNKMAQQLVSTLSSSIETSTKLRTEQVLARQSQSSRFKTKAHDRATERRQSRFQKEKEIEEMAVDRRRRWQRQNPDAGRYRPSGDRQRSPNNC